MSVDQFDDWVACQLISLMFTVMPSLSMQGIVFSDKMVCCRHVAQLCNCTSSKCILFHRYSAKYMQDVLDKLKHQVETYFEWSTEVTIALNGDSGHKPGSLCDRSYALIPYVVANNLIVWNTLLQMIIASEHCIGWLTSQL